MAADFKPVDHENLGELVYNSIASALISGSLRPGERLRIRELAADMKTSVTPVRDAMLRLVQDQALVLKNPRDIRVPDLSIEDYLEIRDIRIELEGIAAERAARLATPADLKRLVELVRATEDAIDRHDNSAGAEANQQFHFELVAIARMPVLAGIINRLWMRTGPLIADIYGDGGKIFTEHHHPIVDAIRNKDAEGARHAMQHDILEGSQVIVTAKTRGKDRAA